MFKRDLSPAQSDLGRGEHNFVNQQADIGLAERGVVSAQAGADQGGGLRHDLRRDPPARAFDLALEVYNVGVERRQPALVAG